MREEFLVFGVAGPAIAAALMLMLRRANVRLLPGLFLLLLAGGWVVLVLADSSKAELRALDWNPLLILPALLPALSAAFFVGAGEIRWPGWRWPLIAALAMPAFLLIPASVSIAVLRLMASKICLRPLVPVKDSSPGLLSIRVGADQRSLSGLNQSAYLLLLLFVPIVLAIAQGVFGFTLPGTYFVSLTYCKEPNKLAARIRQEYTSMKVAP